MTSVAEMDQFGAARGGPVAPEFRIAVVYETQALGSIALNLCERLMASFRNMFRFRVAVESFAALEEEERFKTSLHAANGADMIFVGSAGSLPASLLRWLDECIDRRREDAPVALVDLTAEDGRDVAAVRRFLKSVAQTNHLDLISPESFGGPSGLTNICPAPLGRATNIRHWGINE